MVRPYWCKADFGSQLLLSLLLLANGERKGVTGGHWQWHWEIPQNPKVEIFGRATLNPYLPGTT